MPIAHRANNLPAPIWTLEAIQEHNKIVDDLKEKLDTERDRRYSEVNIEREKALKIKEEADKAALGLAREIQSYNDEKANQLREQISSERGTFASKEDLAAMMREIAASIQPLTSFVAGQAGKTQQAVVQQENLRGNTGIAVMIISGLALLCSVIMPILLHSVGK
jgi:uncharacterized protein YukE